jgi:FlaA1/EpsC-like NDP-sugar epimerase
MTSVYLAFALSRNQLFAPNLSDTLAILAIVPAIALSFLYFRVYRAIIRHLDISTIFTICLASVAGCAIWSIVYILFWDTHDIQVDGILFQWLLCIAMIVGYRLAFYQMLGADRVIAPDRENCAIFGTSQASRQLADALTRSEKYKPAFYFSTDPSISGARLKGLRIYHTSRQDWAFNRFNVKTLLISSDESHTSKSRALIRQLLDKGITVRVNPSLDESLRYGSAQSLLRNLDINDLIGRASQPAKKALLERAVKGRHVLVTGAAGSIGKQLCRRIAGLEPASLHLVDFNENELKQIWLELSQKGGPEVRMYLGSITDERFTDGIFRQHSYDSVFHTAAYKHIDVGQSNPVPVVYNNVVGTANLVRAANRSDVSRFVLISTDKAVNPSSIMGASKQWCEYIVRSAGTSRGKAPAKAFCSVRFGNVIESSGSVVPLFKKQIENGGPVTITDNAMERYFMSIDEAVDLILQAAALSKGGEAFVLDMGRQIKIRDIAETLIQLAGFTVKSNENPGGDIEIRQTGIRPGEKLSEELYNPSENTAATEHEAISVSLSPPPGRARLNQATKKLLSALAKGDESKVSDILFSELSK